MVGASPSTVLSWVDRGWLPAHRTPGGHRRIERQALVEFLRAHEMPDVVQTAEPFRILLALATADDAKKLADDLRATHLEAKVDIATGVVETLANVFESPPDALVVDAALPGIDVTVLCRELVACTSLTRVRIVVARPVSESAMDDPLRRAGIWSTLDSPPTADSVAECLALGSYDPARTKAS